MIISLKKFGTTLISRSAGKEALLAFEPILRAVKNNEEIEMDFEGVVAIGPSWLDEFLTPIQKRYKNIVLKNTENPSVKATLAILKA